MREAGRRVAIVGAALSDCGRVDDKTAFHLHQQATSRALADAGLTKDDVDGFMSCGMGSLAPIEVAEYLGMGPMRWVDGTSVGGSSWEFYVEHAAAAISAGLADVIVAAYGSTTRANLKRGIRTANLSFGVRGPQQFDAPYGHTLMAKYAMAARRHMHEFGTTAEQLAEIAVSARYNASLNPGRLLPRPDHHRGRAERADGCRPVHQAALLHPLGRRRRRRVGRRRSGRATVRRSRYGCSVPARRSPTRR